MAVCSGSAERPGKAYGSRQGEIGSTRPLQGRGKRDSHTVTGGVTSVTVTALRGALQGGHRATRSRRPFEEFRTKDGDRAVDKVKNLRPVPGLCYQEQMTANASTHDAAPLVSRKRAEHHGRVIDLGGKR